MKKTDNGARVSYLHRHLISESRLMKNIARKLDLDHKAIQVSPYEGQIIATLVALKNPQVSLEIGTLYGYSACWILGAMGKRSRLYTIEADLKNYTEAFRFLKKHEKYKQVELQNSSGLEALESWPEGLKIDFLFLDADKGNYLNYLNLAKPYLSNGAVVIADNSFLFGYALEDSPPKDYSKNTWRSMRELNRVLSGKTGEFKGMALPTLQGMTIGVKIC